MTSLKSFRLNLSIVFGLFLIAASASAADWPTFRWRVPSRCDAELILTANLVFAGGQGQVNAFSRNNGQAVWEAKVDGKARGIAVSDNLEIELVAQDKKLSSKNGVPILCGVEVLRERKAAEVATMVHTRQ